MGVSSIGVQAILPRSGAGWPDPSPTPAQPNDSEDDDAPPKRDRPEPAPDVGQIVDKIV